MDLSFIPGPIDKACAKSSGLRLHWPAKATDNNRGPFEAHFRGLKY